MKKKIKGAEKLINAFITVLSHNTVKNEQRNGMCLGIDSGNAPQKVSFASYVFISLFVILLLLFLCLTFYKSNDYAIKRRYCLTGQGSLVVPGPGDTSPTSYVIGEMTFHMTEPYIQWVIWHNYTGTDVVTELDLIGPTSAVAPDYGPVFLILCKSGSARDCLVPTGQPHVLRQQIQMTISGYPIDDMISTLLSYILQYQVLIRTSAYPGGAMVAKLDKLC